MSIRSLPLRNLIRKPGRAAIMVTGIGVGVIAMLLAGGFVEWIFRAMRESTILFRTGHVQLVQPGYLDQGVSGPGEFLLPSQDPDFQRLENHPWVKTVAPRLSFSGLASHGDTTVAFLGEGMEPDREKLFSPELSIVKGEGLSPDKPLGAILGIGLAENLGVHLGDSIVLLSNAATGGANAIEVEVIGMFTTASKPFDDAALRIPLVTAQRLIKVSGVQRWVVLLRETEKTKDFLRLMPGLLGGANAKYQIVPWYDLADFYKKTVTLFSSQMDFLGGIIGIMIVLGISNAQIMAVLDRTAEIGTLMALGRRRRQILWLFLSESFLLAVIGSLLGTGLGWGLAELVSFIGIPMPPAPGTNTSYTAEILVTWPLVLKSIGVAFGATCLAGVVPAWKASRLPIVDALRKAR